MFVAKSIVILVNGQGYGMIYKPPGSGNWWWLVVRLSIVNCLSRMTELSPTRLSNDSWRHLFTYDVLSLN